MSSFKVYVEFVENNK